MWFEPRVPGLIHGNLSLDDLNIDEAFLSVTSPQSDSWLYALPSNCHQCPFSLLSEVSGGEERVLTVSTKHSWRFRVTNVYSGDLLPGHNTTSVVCDVGWKLGQFGVYELEVHDGTSHGCKTNTINEPVNIYPPLIFMTCLLLVLGLLYKFVAFSVRKIQKKKMDLNLNLENVKPEVPSKASRRLASLDTFRGISILLMIFVNDGAGGYSILEHADWDGLQLADVVFPWFLWIMGVCIPISIKSQLKKHISRLQILLTVFRRSCVLFALGVMLNTLGIGPQLETIRIFGVLQRFGILYMTVGGICAILWPQNPEQGTGRWSALRDLRVVWPQWAVHLCLHAAHLAIVSSVHASNCPSGYLGPGGISEEGINENCTGGATGYIDLLILGKEHLYQNPTSRIVYGSGPFDPEGPYGCLPSMLMVMFGVQAGATLLSFPTWQARARRWAIWGVTCILVCAPLAATGAIPINKNLWSTSFSLATGGLAFLLLTLCYILVDVCRIWHGSPFIFPGMNATIMYVGHMVAYQLWPFHWRIGSMNTHAWMLLEDLWGVAAWTVVAFQLYRNKFFLSI